jgi:dipeptidyl aminopeptidase/acylaminoacyl peptidase
MTDHDEFDRSLSERLRAAEARVPGATAPDLATIGMRSARGRPAWGWGALVAAGGVAAGLLLVLFLGGRLQPPTGHATATPQPTSSASGTVAPSASIVPSAPSLSSLGGLIAFSRDGDVYTMRPDGSQVTQLTATTDAAELPVAWLADGSRLVIQSTPNDNPYASTLSLLMPDGTVANELGVVYPIYSAAMYSPDGTKIAFGGDGSTGSGIVILDLESGTFGQLTTDGGHGILWSPDGTRIAYQFHNTSTSSNDVGVVGLDGSAMTVAPHPSQDTPLRWVVVGGTLMMVFDSQRDTDETKFSARPWVVNSDGTGLQLLADSGLDPQFAEHATPTRISPDGAWVASTCDFSLCLTPTDGGEALVFEGADGSDIWTFSPSWSPDLAHLAYADTRGIQIVFLPDGAAVTITPPCVSDSAPVWQPVGG